MYKVQTTIIFVVAMETNFNMTQILMLKTLNPYLYVGIKTTLGCRVPFAMFASELSLKTVKLMFSVIMRHGC